MGNRAPRNRTLQLTEADRSTLRPRLLFDASLDGTAAQLDNRIVCADLFKVLPLLPAEMADLIIVDPPYNLRRRFDKMQFEASSATAYAEYVRSWLPQLVRLLKPAGSLYLCGDWQCTAVLQAELSRSLTIINRITWQREKGRGAAANWKNSMEDIWFAVKDARHYYFNLDAVRQKRRVLAPYTQNGQPKDWQAEPEGRFRLTCPSNFWDDITIPFWSMKENTPHPTQKPEKLFAKLILASSAPGALVFDPFLGSGTSAVTAKKLGRRYCGVEWSEDYCLMAEKRLAMADTDPSIQGYADGVFLERNTAVAVARKKT